MSDDIGKKRADLRARIKKARANLAYVKRCEADLAKQTAILRKGKARLQRVAPVAKGALFAQANKDIALAEQSQATAAKSAAAARATATELIQVLRAELDQLTE